MNGEEVSFFAAEAARHGRTLPFGEAVKFFRGFVRATEGALGFEEEDALRATVLQISQCDQQLQLIAAPQLQLDLPPAKSAAKRKVRRAA